MASESCVFCNIGLGKVPETKILYQDAEVVVFADHRPASTHHYLVIPRLHIKNAKYLTHEHIPLVDALIRAGRQVLQEQGGDLNDVRMGFHYPPLVLVSHLHLHIISPASQMGFFGRLSFRDNSYWFASLVTEAGLEKVHSRIPKCSNARKSKQERQAEWVQDHLRKMADEMQGKNAHGNQLEVE